MSSETINQVAVLQGKEGQKVGSIGWEAYIYSELFYRVPGKKTDTYN